MIKYKVVRKADRESCIVPKHSEYCLKYSKGIVRAVPGSFGIMVFKTKVLAQDFANEFNIILKVRPIGKCRKPCRLSDYSTFFSKENTRMFDIFYDCYKKNYRKKFWWRYVDTIQTPPGTECYPAVEVLE